MLNLPDSAPRAYLRALDGVRGVSILLVVLSHTSSAMASLFPGMLGVIVFFTLSGFLITDGLLHEISGTGTLCISRFYMKRALRLLPSLLFYFIVFIPLLTSYGANIGALHIASGILGFANYYHIFIGYPPYNPMPILWSLSVETHYYLLFPWLVFLYRKDANKLFFVISCLIIITLAWRSSLYGICADTAHSLCGLPEKLRMQGTDAIFDTILYGALAALTLKDPRIKTQQILVHNSTFLIAIAALLASLAIRNDYFRETLRYSIQAAAIAVIIIHVISGNTPVIQKTLETRMLVFIGKISYPLYLMHFGTLIAIEQWHGRTTLVSAADIALYFSGSLFLACVAYFFLEKPVRAWRTRFFFLESTA